MPLSDNISTGMENLTAVGLGKFNLTDQEFPNKNFSNTTIEFQEENQSTNTGRTTYLLT